MQTTRSCKSLIKVGVVNVKMGVAEKCSRAMRAIFNRTLLWLILDPPLKRQYDQRVREIEHATFTPLVLSTTGGMGRAATTFFKRLASMIAEKRDIPYAQTLNWIRCRLSFALLRASIMSIRGARSSRHQPASS